MDVVKGYESKLLIVRDTVCRFIKQIGRETRTGEPGSGAVSVNRRYDGYGQCCSELVWEENERTERFQSRVLEGSAG